MKTTKAVSHGSFGKMPGRGGALPTEARPSFPKIHGSMGNMPATPNVSNVEAGATKHAIGRAGNKSNFGGGKEVNASVKQPKVRTYAQGPQKVK